MIDKKILILPCAGNGSRFGDILPKQYYLIDGKTILEHTLQVFASIKQIDQIIIVTSKKDSHIDDIIEHSDFGQKTRVLKVGGQTRAHTVRNAVNIIKCDTNSWLLVHDVARCCISKDAVLRLISNLENDKVGGILAISAADTIKQSVDGAIIDQTLDRGMIYQAQTPQMFRAHVLQKALNYAKLDLITDEASAVEQLNLDVKLIEGERANIKVTYPIDIKLAEIILNSRS